MSVARYSVEHNPGMRRPYLVSGTLECFRTEEAARAWIAAVNRWHRGEASYPGSALEWEQA